jgi:hypothetical protein
MGAPSKLKNGLGFSAPLRFFSPARGVSQSLRIGDLLFVSSESVMAVLLNTKDVPTFDFLYLYKSTVGTVKRLGPRIVKIELPLAYLPF